MDVPELLDVVLLEVAPDSPEESARRWAGVRAAIRAAEPGLLETKASELHAVHLSVVFSALDLVYFRTSYLDALDYFPYSDFGWRTGDLDRDADAWLVSHQGRGDPDCALCQAFGDTGDEYRWAFELVVSPPRLETAYPDPSRPGTFCGRRAADALDAVIAAIAGLMLEAAARFTTSSDEAADGLRAELERRLFPGGLPPPR